VSTNNALIIAVVVTLSGLCFSGQVMAYQRSNEAQLYSDVDIDTASLASLYPHPDDYLWLNEQQLKHQATVALEFIADAVNHGLNSTDYHFDLLQQLDPALNESEAQLFDRVLSDGLLKLIRDLSVGRLDPDVVDPQWSIPRESFNATAFLQQALSANDFKASLSSLIPVSRQYMQLKAAAARYQDYVERGGWQTIPATAVLRTGDQHVNIAAVRDRLSFEVESINQVRPSKLDYYDKELEQVVKQFQRRHSLIADGIIGPATLREMNVSAADRLQQININLERLRWLPDDLGDRYIMVNLANYRLTAIEDDEVKLDMRVIVGKTKRSTPSFSSQMTHIVLNPKWYVPNKLARLDLLPKQQANPGYFQRYNFRVFNFEDGIKKEISPDTVDWQAMSEQ
jgi:murein L,D-transpeptidase YcbB/YkuD